MRAEIRLAGSGGQGIILAAKVLAEAAGIYGGLTVVQSQIYGAAARGELSKADVILDDGDIYTLEITNADIMLCLSQEAYDTFGKSVKSDGMIIIDEFYVKKYERFKKNIFPFQISQSSNEIAGSEIATNIVACGIITVLGGYFSKEYTEKAVEKNVPKPFLEMNIKALTRGFEMAEQKKNIC